MEKTETSTDVNRCRRCNRKLKDPSAKYGWRCAEILGVVQSLNDAGDDAFNAYMLAMKEADEFLRKNKIDPKKIDLVKFYESYIKQYLAAGMNDRHTFQLAYEDMLAVLSPQYNVPLSAKTPSIASMIHKKDIADYHSGRYVKNGYPYDLRQKRSESRAVDRTGNVPEEGGALKLRTQRALDAGQVLGDIGKGIMAHSAQTKYGVYHTGGDTVFGIIDKAKGRIKNGKPVGMPMLRIDGPHENAPTPHLNTNHKKYPELKRFDHTELPESVFKLAKSGNDIVELAKIGGKALAFGGTVADVYELGSTIYFDLNDKDKKLGKKTLQTSVGIGGSYAGGYGGAKLGAMGGAALGNLICPGLGFVIGGILGSIGGGILGSLGGRALGEHIVDKTYKGE